MENTQNGPKPIPNSNSQPSQSPIKNGNLLIPKEIEDALPAMVKSELAKLSNQKQQEFIEEYKRKSKNTGIGYVLWLFTCHYAYLGNWGMQIFFWLTFGGAGIWWLIDLFRIGNLIKDQNRDVALDIMRNLKTFSS